MQNPQYQQNSQYQQNPQYQQNTQHPQNTQYPQNPQYQQNTQLPQNAQYPQNPQYQQNTQYQQGPPEIAPQPPSEPVTLTPEEEKQLQHIQRFARIFQLPMFALYTGAEAAKQQQREQDRQRMLVDMAKIKADAKANQPQLTTTDKVTLGVLGAATGTTFLSKFNVDRGLGAAASFITTMDSIDQNNKLAELLTIVRWASPPEATYAPIIVDVLEVRGTAQKQEGAWCHVKANRDFKVKIGTKYEKKIKKGDRWSKTVRGPSTVSIIEKGVGEFPLEMVQSVQMPMDVADYVNVLKRFKKQWIVPN